MNYSTKDDNYWKENLPPEKYEVLRKKATERPFTGDLLENKEPGIYRCGGCGAELFSSETKFDSGSGWPSFWDAIDPSKIVLQKDNTLFVPRIEVLCANCGGPLGHVFEDGPNPTGKRYCINSCALAFEGKKK